MNSARLESHGVVWATLTPTVLQGSGRVRPTLRFSFAAKAPQEGIRTQIVRLRVTLQSSAAPGEILADGETPNIGAVIASNDGYIDVEFPVTREVIQFIQEGFRDYSLFFYLNFNGLLRVRDDRPVTEERQSELQHQLEMWRRRPFGLGPLTPGEWHMVSTEGYDASTSFEVHRGVWIERILRPLGIGDYIVIDMPVPAVPNREQYEAALAHLRTAEEHFLQGNDASVLHHCNAAFEGLAGAPQHIFDRIDDSSKR